MRCGSLGHNIWRCSLDPRDIDKIACQNTFWCDVLKSWSEYNYYQEYREENQIIWYNSKIQIKGKPFFWKNNYERGLIYVYQLFQDMEFKSYEKVSEKFGLTMLGFNSLKTALPKELKQFFMDNARSTYTPIPPHTFDMCKEDKSLSNRVYKFISDDAMLMHSKYIKWREELGSDFFENCTLREYAGKHLDIYGLTNITKYRSFQYRLLQRGIVTNVQLLKWKMSPNDLCTFCKSERETLSHIFYDCSEIFSVWVELVQLLEARYNKKVELSRKNVIFNSLVKPKRNVINFICLIFKQYVYRQRCQQKNVIFNLFKRELCRVESIEKYIAQKNCKMSIHEKKWNVVDNQAVDLNQ